MSRKLRIVHVCLRSAYTEGLAYQDNLLPDQNVIDGHEVTVVAGCEKFVGGRIVSTPPETRMTAGGVRLIRLPMVPLGHPLITQRFSAARGLKTVLDRIGPDVILYHGVAGWDMLTVAAHKRLNPTVRLFVDSHEDIYNSGTTLTSLWVQYKLFNNALVRLTQSAVDKYLYISLESRDFLRDNYGLSDAQMDFFPLGGNLVPPDRQVLLRQEIRRREDLAPDAFLVVHSGKLAPEKRTLELARAFSRLENPDACLIVIGIADGEVLSGLADFIQKDPRIRYLGWRTSSELADYIAAADLYAQPGTQSATLQVAICCGAPILAYPYPSYEPFVQGNGFFVRNEYETGCALHALAGDSELVERMILRSRQIASETLSYAAIAKKIYP